MASRRNVKTSRTQICDYNNLKDSDVLCPICRSILIKPISLPCSHGICLLCFNNNVRNISLACPLCNVRIGSWLRLATKANTLVNEAFWQAIQTYFPKQVKLKLNNFHGSTQSDEHVKQNGKRSSLRCQDIAEQLEKGDELQFTVGKDDQYCHKVASRAPVFKVNTCQKSVLNGTKLLNNFASKEYTCRILYQNDTNGAISDTNTDKYQLCGNGADQSDNSIKLNCLYFKPINFWHNPPPEGQTAIKIPSIKPKINSSSKIKAPCGQKNIQISILQSAFVRLWPPTTAKVTNSPPIRKKRKNRKCTVRPNKRQKKQSQRSVINVENHHITDEKDKLVQEAIDYQLACKLQEEYNKISKYSTRSTTNVQHKNIQLK